MERVERRSEGLTVQQAAPSVIAPFAFVVSGVGGEGCGEVAVGGQAAGLGQDGAGLAGGDLTGGDGFPDGAFGGAGGVGGPDVGEG